VVPLREIGVPPEVKIGWNVMLVFAYSVLASSTSVVCGTNWSVLDARHQLGGYAVYQGPWGIELTGLFKYRSGTPLDATKSSLPRWTVSRSPLWVR